MESLEETLNPGDTSAEKPDMFSIKQPPGTRDRVKAMAQRLNMPFRDLARACFEHGLIEFDTEFQKASKRAERNTLTPTTAEQPETSHTDQTDAGADDNPPPVIQ